MVRRYTFGRVPSAIRFKRRRRRSRATYGTVARTRGVYATGEMKYFYVDLTLAPCIVSADWTGTQIDPPTLTLFVPIVGAGISQRIGNSVTVYQILMKCYVIAASQVNQLSGDNSCLIRVILFQDLQTNAAQAQGNVIMKNEGAAFENVFSFQNVANFGRFKVLRDKIIKLEDPNMVWDGSNIETNGIQKHFKLNIKFKQPVVIRFNSTNGGTIADIVDNSFHIICLANDASLATKIYYNARFTFTG